jgi:hypothetical protein
LTELSRHRLDGFAVVAIAGESAGDARFHLQVGFRKRSSCLAGRWSVPRADTRRRCRRFHAATAAGLLFLGVRKRRRGAFDRYAPRRFWSAVLFGIFYVIRGI